MGITHDGFDGYIIIDERGKTEAQEKIAASLYSIYHQTSPWSGKAYSANRKGAGSFAEIVTCANAEDSSFYFTGF
jgi:hypothetical protein